MKIVSPVLFISAKISLSISFASIVFILLLALVAVGVYLYYKRTIPFITLSWRIFLSILRAFAVLLILLAIGEITLGISSILMVKPKTIFLLDRSKSMTHKKDQLETIARQVFETGRGKQNELEIYSFAERLSESSIDSKDSIKFDGASTNISSAISKIDEMKNENNIQNVVLVTDGIYNTGEKPIYAAKKLAVPIYTIGIGDSKQQKDISISNIVSNDIVYAENKTPVRVDIKNFGYLKQQVDVSLFEENHLIERKTLLSKENYNEIFLDYIPKTDGEKKLTASISVLSDEITGKNNSLSKYVTVLSNKLKILLVASFPSNDFSFIKQSLVQNEDVVVRGLIDNPTGDFYPQYRDKYFLDSADVIFFIGYPGSSSSQQLINEVRTAIQRRNIPLFIQISNTTDFNKLQTFKEFLSFEIGTPFGDFSQVLIDVSAVNSKNEILNIDEVNSLETWNSLPPIFRVDREMKAKPGSEVLSYYKIQNTRINQPLIISKNINRQRSISFLGFGIWRLKLLNALKSDENDYFDRFINNCVKWLSSREISKNLRVKLSKKIFDESENVLFTAQLYDESNQPISDANINLELIKSRDTKLNQSLEPLGNGLYQYNFEDLDKGDYTFKASTTYNNQKYEDEGKFTVTETDIEFQNLRMDEELLKQISDLSGGKYFPAKESQEFLKNISKYIRSAAIEKEQTSVNQLWNSALLMVIVIFLLAIEWFFRKRLGLL